MFYYQNHKILYLVRLDFDYATLQFRINSNKQIHKKLSKHFTGLIYFSHISIVLIEVVYFGNY